MYHYCKKYKNSLQKYKFYKEILKQLLYVRNFLKGDIVEVKKGCLKI